VPIFLLLIGVIFLVSSIKGNQQELIVLIKSDFSGSNNFLLWVLAIVLIVALGYFKWIRPISDGFLGLVILVLLIANSHRGSDILTAFVKAGTSQDGLCSPGGKSSTTSAASSDAVAAVSDMLTQSENAISNITGALGF
jgi:hypothetical protein